MGAEAAALRHAVRRVLVKEPCPQDAVKELLGALREMPVPVSTALRPLCQRLWVLALCAPEADPWPTFQESVTALRVSLHGVGAPQAPPPTSAKPRR